MKTDLDKVKIGQGSSERLPAQSTGKTGRLCDRGSLRGQVSGVFARDER